MYILTVSNKAVQVMYAFTHFQYCCDMYDVFKIHRYMHLPSFIHISTNFECIILQFWSPFLYTCLIMYTLLSCLLFKEAVFADIAS